MAHVSQLPCDGDGTCMLCKNKPSDEHKLTCNTCATPWHASCLSVPPQTLASTVNWHCPDCAAPTTSHAPPPPVAPGGARGDLVAAIRAIEADASLTEAQKAKRRQELLSGPDRDIEEEKEKEKKNEMLDIIDENLKCSFCIQLPDRPVTVSRLFHFFLSLSIYLCSLFYPIMCEYSYLCSLHFLILNIYSNKLEILCTSAVVEFIGFICCGCGC